MKTSIKHDQSDRSQWNGRHVSSRLTYLSKLVLAHPQFGHALSEIRRRMEQVIRQGKGTSIVVIAPTGAGKSTLLKYCEETWRDKELPDRTLRRVVAFSVPPRPSPKSMASALLHALGDPRWDVGSALGLTKRACTLMRECRTRLILVDNVHDVPERRGAKGVREVSCWLRDLDEVKALVVMLGAKEALEVCDGNNQLRRRSLNHLNMDYFEFPHDPRRWLRLLFELDKALPLSASSKLAEPKLAGMLWMATRGIIAYLIALTKDAVEITVKDGRESIEIADFEKAFCWMFGDATPATNPFSAGTVLRPLDQEGEPFYRWLEEQHA